MSEFYDEEDDEMRNDPHAETAEYPLRIKITRTTTADGVVVAASIEPHSDITDELAERILNIEIRRMSETMLGERMARVTDESLRALVAQLAEPRVKKVLDEGWQTYNRYGEATGKRVTLTEMIAEWFAAKRDTYSSSGNNLEEIVKAETQRLLSADFKKQLDGVTAKFREQADALLTGRIAEGLRSAFGLK